MSLNETPDTVQWPETHYVFLEKVGPFLQNAPAAWSEFHAIRPEIEEHNSITGYLSLYKMGPQVYRAGVSVAGSPEKLPEGLRYEKFRGGKYTRFVLTGPYAQLGEATGRTAQLLAGQQVPLRDDFNIEHYVTDPRVTPEAELITEILYPTV